MEEYIEEIDKCIGCKTCNSKCPTFNISNNELEAPDCSNQVMRCFQVIQTCEMVF